MCIYHEFHIVKQEKRAFNRILSTRNFCSFGLLLDFTQSLPKTAGVYKLSENIVVSLLHIHTDTALARTVLHARVVQIENENQIRLNDKNKFTSIITITWTNYVHIHNQIRGNFIKAMGVPWRWKKFLPILRSFKRMTFFWIVEVFLDHWEDGTTLLLSLYNLNFIEIIHE